MCISVLCSPPEKCRQYHAVNDKCCEFVCLDGDFTAQNGIRNFNTTIITRGNGDNRNHVSVSTNNLGLRLIASTITSFLILALLLFMIHRLRQRRLLLMIRRLQTRRLEQVNGLSCDNSSSIGYFATHDQYDFGGSFNEPPPPYTFWKPPEHYIPPGEAPPPYDDSNFLPFYEVTNNSVNNRVNNTTNSATSPLPLQQTQFPITVSTQSLCASSTPTFINSPINSLHPIIDTISSDNCYEHITVVRINDSHNINISHNDSNNTCSDSTSSSSIVSSPSNCSVITSSSTSTQSTVRRQDSDTISRL